MASSTIKRFVLSFAKINPPPSTFSLASITRGRDIFILNEPGVCQRHVLLLHSGRNQPIGSSGFAPPSSPQKTKKQILLKYTKPVRVLITISAGEGQFLDDQQTKHILFVILQCCMLVPVFYQDLSHWLKEKCTPSSTVPQEVMGQIFLQSRARKLRGT